MPTYMKYDLNVNNMMEKDYTGHVRSLYCVVLMNKQYKYLKRILVGFFWIWGFWSANRFMFLCCEIMTLSWYFYEEKTSGLRSLFF